MACWHPTPGRARWWCRRDLRRRSRPQKQQLPTNVGSRWLRAGRAASAGRGCSSGSSPSTCSTARTAAQGTDDHRGHPSAGGDREDLDPPGAGSAATAPGSGAPSPDPGKPWDQGRTDTRTRRSAVAGRAQWAQGNGSTARSKPSAGWPRPRPPSRAFDGQGQEAIGRCGTSAHSAGERGDGSDAGALRARFLEPMTGFILSSGREDAAPMCSRCHPRVAPRLAAKALRFRAGTGHAPRQTGGRRTHGAAHPGA
jgi:hypothetical protein